MQRRRLTTRRFQKCQGGRRRSRHRIPRGRTEASRRLRAKQRLPSPRRPRTGRRPRAGVASRPPQPGVSPSAGRRQRKKPRKSRIWPWRRRKAQPRRRIKPIRSVIAATKSRPWQSFATSAGIAWRPPKSRLHRKRRRRRPPSLGGGTWWTGGSSRRAARAWRTGGAKRKPTRTDTWSPSGIAMWRAATRAMVGSGSATDFCRSWRTAAPFSPWRRVWKRSGGPGRWASSRIRCGIRPAVPRTPPPPRWPRSRPRPSRGRRGRPRVSRRQRRPRCRRPVR
mmetsp:Transcript_75016/g.243832  ORF Transcript_75016/g.243832 Transcript_75016/m.243832 type:complete len:280 (-) Transcript_75016:2443-3282(-)